MNSKAIGLLEQIKLLDNDWQTCFKEKIKDGSLEKLDAFLTVEKEKGKIILPTIGSTFRALSMSRFLTTKVVVLGQDPYHGEENDLPQANGLAFSVQEEMRPPPSLKNIFIELEREYPRKFLKKKRTSCLDSWAKQGVLLLNSVLSVEKMKPASHRNKGWEPFTDMIISGLAKKRPNLVFLLWGAHAKKKIPQINQHNKNKQHLILTAPHPSPLSAYRGFIGCNHFKLTNEFLLKKNLDPIVWESILKVESNIRRSVT